jgi:threonine efflux protein
MDALSALPAILATALVAAASPGPATLAIVGTAMADGRRTALRLALGVLSGSLIWSIAAAAGLAALMLTHGWIVQAIRYAGAVYLACLAWTCARAAWRGGAATGMAGGARPYRRGLMLHLTPFSARFILIIEQVLNGLQFGVMLFLMAAGPDADLRGDGV